MSTLEQAVQYHRDGKIEEARKIYSAILEKEPDNATALNLYGVLILQSGKASDARVYFEKAVKLNPCAAFLENLGFAYFCEQNFENSAKYYEAAFAKEPTLAGAQQLLICYEKINKLHDAARFCNILLENEPNNLELIRRSAKIYNRTGQYEKALNCYLKSCELDKRDFVAMNNAGLMYEKLHNLKKAREYYVRSLKIKENYEALHNLGVLCRKERKFEDSIRLLKRALVHQPDNIETKTSLGMTYFTIKDFENGCKYYRQRNPELKKKFKNEWTGEKHPDSTLLIYYEGGHGDQIMFCRYIKYLHEYFDKIKILVYPNLVELFRFNFPGLEVYTFEDNPDYDYSVNIMEIHYVLKMDFEHIPSAAHYLRADPVRAVEFSRRIFTTDKKKVGLFWQGNSRVFKNRAISLEQLKPLFSLKNIQFYSFQVEDKLNQIANFAQIINLESELKSFSDTASALMNVDVLVTIDSAIAHLAGALGIKTYLLLPYASEWRWFSETKTTQWYPSVEIFKQTEAENWQDVVKDVFTSLEKL